MSAPKNGAAASQSANGGTPGLTHHIFVTWPKSYHTLADLKRDAHVAVLGTIASIQAQPNFQGSQHAVVYTDFRVDVARVLHDPQHRLTKPSLLLRQVGGIEDGQQVEVSEDPLFRVGEEVVVFLAEGTPGLYHVIGGPTGRFEIVGGQVTPASARGVPFAQPVPLSDFLTRVDQA